MTHKVENFKYNGFYVDPQPGYADYTISHFVRWTDDPGVGIFLCSDSKERLIPTCQITNFNTLETPTQEKTGVMFGQPSHS